jgi:uncharacterized protein YjbI with pentapeptide repeats
MANWWHLHHLKRGTTHWNTWRERHPQICPDLGKADMGGYNLNGANLSNTYLGKTLLKLTNLRGANLRGSHLHWASLMGADLSGANLAGTYLCDVDLSGADLSHADLRGADLSTALVNGVNLRGANLDRATFARTIIAKTDLRTTRGLAGIIHRDASDFEIFSVQLPQDGSALSFLRGVGVPDRWIETYGSFAAQPIQYHSCFISYAHEDERAARRLHADLQDHGVRCWFAPHNMHIGDKIRQRIDEAIHLQDKLLLILSQAALESEWIETEVEIALDKEKRQNRDVLFPVRIDDRIMHTTQAWARHLCLKRHIGEFCCWTDPQQYQLAFDRLLCDLKQPDR